jgi:hypothetical protein
VDVGGWVGVGATISTGGTVAAADAGAAVGFGEQPERTSPREIIISRRELNTFSKVFMVIHPESLANYSFRLELHGNIKLPEFTSNW